MAIAINGSSNTITGLAVGGLPDGVVDTDMLAANAVTAAKASGSAKGITMAQLWRINTTFAATASIITSNWEVQDQAGAGSVGSSMSESSGVFTFPSTGIYFIQFTCAYFSTQADRRYLGAYIDATVNNSAYSSAAVNYTNTPNISGGDTHTTVTTSTIFDVTDTSTHKCKFGLAPVGTSQIFANTNENYTYVVFIRLGDT